MRRGAVAVTVATVAVLAFALVGGVGLAGNGKGKASRHGLGQYQYGMGQYQYGARLAICHKRHHTIVVSRAGLAAHLRHGDVPGACAHEKRKHRLFRSADGMPRPAPESGAAQAAEADDDDDHGRGHGKGHGKGRSHDG